MKLFIIGFISFLCALCSCATPPDRPDSSATPKLSPLDEALRPDKTDAILIISEIVRNKCDRVGFEKLSHAEQVFYVVDELEMEVNNGGFDQFFFNSSGDQAALAYDAFMEIGATKIAGIIKRANAIFPDEIPPADRERRWKLMERNEAKNSGILDKLDEEFYKYPDPLAELLLAYVRKNRAQFD